MPQLSPASLRRLWPTSPVIRVLVAVNLIRTIGSGLLLTLTTLYFAEEVGLTPTEVGAGLTVAAVGALLVGLPSGLLSDALGARAVSVVLRVASGACVALFVIADDVVTYVVATSVFTVINTAAGTAASALVGSVMEPGERVRGRAVMRVASNIGVAVGAVAGGLVLAVDDTGLYAAAFLFSGVSIGVSGLGYLRLLPRPAPAPSPDEPPARVLRDAPYLAVSAISAVLSVHDVLLVVALPLWISTQTSAPAWTYSTIVLVNGLLVVLLQIRLAGVASTTTGAAHALRWTGVALAVTCVLWGLAGSGTALVAVGLVLVGALTHTVAELLHSAGGWGLSYELAPEHAHGQYQGVFGMALQAVGVVTPLAAGAFLVSSGMVGWLVLGVVLLAVGLAAPRATRWAERTRPSADALVGPA